MSDEEPVRDGEFSEFLDALEAGEGYYLESDDGTGWLPPRAVDPRTGESSLSEEPLPETGTVETYTVIRVPTPRFSEDAPFALAVVDVGPVKLTGQVRGVAVEDVEIGMEVAPTVTTTETNDERLIAFEPTEARHP